MECPKCKGKGYTEKEHGLIQVACKLCNETGNVYGYQLVPSLSAAKVPPVRETFTDQKVETTVSDAQADAVADGEMELSDKTVAGMSTLVTALAAQRSASAIKAAATRKANRAKKAVAA